MQEWKHNDIASCHGNAHVVWLQVALSLNNLASLLRKMDKNAQAEELYKKALAIREDALGANHPQARALTSL